jgi:hypothetical protein
VQASTCVEWHTAVESCYSLSMIINERHHSYYYFDHEKRGHKRHATTICLSSLALNIERIKHILPSRHLLAEITNIYS